MKGGRHRSKEGIIYPFDVEISKLDNKMHLTGIDFDSLAKDYKIIVMNHQPGIGKTYTVMNYIMDKCRKDDNFTFFYFTDKHKTIDEHLKRLLEEDKDIVETFAHWKGFGKHCKDHPESENINRLLGFNVPIDRVKELYKLKDIYSRYLDQFKNTKRVFAPFQYLSDDNFTNNPPQIVFLDERVSQIETYSFDGDDISEVLKLIKAPPEYIEHAKSGTKEDIKFFWNKDVRGNIEKLYNNAIISAVQRGIKRFDVYKKFNPNKLLPYLTWSKIYGYKIDSYSLPFYYKALDVVTDNKVPIVILDATFNKDLFSYFLESYNWEMSKYRPKSYKGFKNLKVKILTSNVTNSKSIIIRMHPKGAWPKASFITEINKTWPWLLEDLHELRKIFGDANIGIITHKELRWVFESMNFDVEYYGNLRGTNKLENKHVLVIVGTWRPIPPSWTDDEDSFDKNKDYIDFLAKKYFLTTIEEKDALVVRVGAPLTVEEDFPQIYRDPKSKARIKMTIENKINSGEGLLKYASVKYADKVAEYPLSMINTIWFDELYQAFHRNRGLRYPRIIFSYAWFPEPRMSMRIGEEFMVPELMTTNYNLRKEFKGTKEVSESTMIEYNSVCKVIRKDDREEIFNKYRKQFKGGIMQDLMKHIELDVNSDEIQKKFKIHKKGGKRGALTPPITELRNKYKNLKDLIEYKES